MIQRVRSFITKVQNAEEATRRMWMIVLSGVSMLIIIALWMAYASARITAVPQPTQPRPVQLVQEDSHGITDVLAAGVHTIVGGIKNVFSFEREVVITKPDFQVRELPSIPKTSLVQ